MELLSFGGGGWGDELAWGLLGTVSLALTSLPFGLILGLLLGFARAADDPNLRRGSNIIATVFRGMPELLTILLAYILGQRLLNGVATSFGFEGAATLSLFWAGVIALTMVFAAYASEVFLGSLQAMKADQLQAAAALGLGPIVTLRFITLPEIFRLSAPGLSNLWLSLLKQTSLVSVIGYDDLMHSGYIAASSTGERIFFYVVIFVLYFGLCSLAGPLFGSVLGVFSAHVPKRA